MDDVRRVQSGVDEVIHLDRTDDIDTLLTRLEWVEGRHALIVVPGVSDMLANLVSLRLLKRKARSLNLDILLVARDGQTQVYAREVGLRVYAFLQTGKFALWRLQRRHGSARGVIARDGVPGRAEPRPAKKRRRKARKVRLPGDRFRLRTLPSRGKFLSQAAMALILLALGTGLSYAVVLLVPQATITVVPAIKRVSEATQVYADLDARRVDYASKTIPARTVILRVEGSAQIATVSTEDAPNSRATGKVVFVNRTPQEIDIPPGTVVRTSTGTNIRFTTVQTTTLGSGVGAKAEAEIVAVAPGLSGNVGAFAITAVEGSQSLQLSVVNERPTSGGDVRQVRIVTYADKDRLKRLLLQQLRQEAYVRITGELDPQEFAPQETLQVFVVSEIYDKYVDELADTLGLKMEVSANAIVIAGQDANALALDALQTAVSSDYYVIAQGLTFERGSVTQIDENRRVTFSMEAAGTAVARIDTRGLREVLKGQPIPKAEAIVSERLPLRESPVVEVRPDWFGLLPQLPFRITILVVTDLG